MAIALTAGANTSLPDASTVSVRLSASASHADLIALLLDEHLRADGDNGVVLFSNPVSAAGAVSLDVATDTLSINIGALPSQVERVLVVAQADGTADLTACETLTATISADGVEVATAAFSDVPRFPTLQMVELYRRNGAWKVRARGDGYGDGLAKLLTVHGIDVADEPTSADAPPVPADPISLEKQRRIDLTKRIEASGGVDMVKKFETAAISLDKEGLTGQRAEVMLVLDVSGSARGLFKRGTYQQLVDRALAAGLLFDDNGTIETWLFDGKLRAGEDVTLASQAGWADRARKTKGIWGSTAYAPPIEEIAGGLTRGATMPTFVFFVTDGGNQDRRQTEKAIKTAATLPAFFKFMAIGDEDDFPFLQKLDDLSDREIDNADFFAVRDPMALSDEEFYRLVMQEFRGWLQAARARGILGA